MAKFLMKSKSAPKSFPAWFRGYEEGKTFTAPDKSATQRWLNDKCLQAGTVVDEFLIAMTLELKKSGSPMFWRNI